MNLKEYQGKKLFHKYGINIPKGVLLNLKNYQKINPFDDIKSQNLVLKAQIPIGKRGKSGGVIFVSQKDYFKKINELFNKNINGYSVKQILAEEMLSIKKEIYLSITIDRQSKGLILIYSFEGGMDIEELNKKSPDKIKKILIDKDFDNNLNSLPKDIKEIGYKLLKLVKEEKALLTEINPLIITNDNQLIAADSKIVIDDNSLPKKNKFNFVKLDGNIGVIGNGAGLVMSTLDTIFYFNGKPANFLDIGGGADKEKMFSAIDKVIKNRKVKGLLINIFGGITRCDQIAQGIVDYKKEKGLKIPLVVRLVGTEEEAGIKILKEAGIECEKEMNDSIKKIIKLVN